MGVERTPSRASETTNAARPAIAERGAGLEDTSDYWEYEMPYSTAPREKYVRITRGNMVFNV